MHGVHSPCKAKKHPKIIVSSHLTDPKPFFNPLAQKKVQRTDELRTQGVQAKIKKYKKIKK